MSSQTAQDWSVSLDIGQTMPFLPPREHRQFCPQIAVATLGFHLMISRWQRESFTVVLLRNQPFNPVLPYSILIACLSSYISTKYVNRKAYALSSQVDVPLMPQPSVACRVRKAKLAKISKRERWHIQVQWHYLFYAQHYIKPNCKIMFWGCHVIKFVFG